MRGAGVIATNAYGIIICIKSAGQMGGVNDGFPYSKQPRLLRAHHFCECAAKLGRCDQIVGNAPSYLATTYPRRRKTGRHPMNLADRLCAAPHFI